MKDSVEKDGAEPRGSCQNCQYSFSDINCSYFNCSYKELDVICCCEFRRCSIILVCMY